MLHIPPSPQPMYFNNKNLDSHLEQSDPLRQIILPKNSNMSTLSVGIETFTFVTIFICRRYTKQNIIISLIGRRHHLRIGNSDIFIQ